MDIFAQKKILTRIIILLLVLNIGTMGLYLYKEFGHFDKPELFPNQKEFRDVSSILKKELNLTTEQTEQIKRLRENVFEKEKELTEVIRAERDSMNVAMFNKNTNEDEVKVLANRISTNEYKMEMIRLEQSKQLKTICTAEQLEKFEKLVLEIRDYFRPDNQPKINK